MLADLLVGVELLGPSHRLRFGDAGAETLPRDDRRDRLKGVLLALSGGDHRPANPGIEADFVIDGAGVGLEGASLPALGTAEHAADKRVEQADGLVGQAGVEIQRDGNQRRVPALPLVVGDMLPQLRGRPRA